MRSFVGKRERLAEIMDHLAVLRPLGSIRACWQCDLPILAYHRVVDIGIEDDFAFDPELISASCSQFREQMEYVRAHYDPIRFSDLLSAFDGGAPLPDRPLIVTFDDGYIDNYTNAFPILRELQIPATIFVSTGYVGGTNTFWYDHVAYALYRAPEGELTLPGLGPRMRLDDVASRRRAAGVAVRHLCRIPDAHRRQCIQRLAAEIDFDIKPADRAWSQPMTWAQVREMCSAGIEFGAHTVNHAVLSQCDDDVLQRELVGSKARLEQETGTSVDVMSYPFGYSNDYDERTSRAVRAAGFRLAASYLPGRNDLRRARHFELRRLHVERYTSMASLASMLALPQLFARA